MTRHCSACGTCTSNRRIVCSSFESTIQPSCATVIASWLNVRSVVRNSRIVSEGPEGCGRLKIDLTQLIMFPPKFHLFEPVFFHLPNVAFSGAPLAARPLQGLV